MTYSKTLAGCGVEGHAKGEPSSGPCLRYWVAPFIRTRCRIVKASRNQARPSSLLFVLLLLVLWGSPAWAWPDDYNAHFGTNGTCNEHLAHTESIDVQPHTFVLCVGRSMATALYAEIQDVNNRRLCKSAGNLDDPWWIAPVFMAPVQGKFTFSCSVPLTTQGIYKGVVTWGIGNSPHMTHVDMWFCSGMGCTLLSKGR